MSESCQTTQRDLSGWLSYLEQIHPSTIEMGLERTQCVYDRLNLSFADSTVITVAGTNGKGTTCRVVEALAMAQGLSVGVYSSPHIVDYRERVRINDALLPELEHIQAFEKVEDCRKEVSLTYFEFGTLAALHLLASKKLDVIILEVGLGGRLDAVNIVDPDVAVITTIDLDHQDWLGNTRELVAKEKAGILRANKPAIIGDLEPPKSLLDATHKLACQSYYQHRQFGYEVISDKCRIWMADEQWLIDADSQFPLQNIATAIATTRILGWPLDATGLNHVLNTTSLPGRCQVMQTEPTVIVDVAHNPQATAYLLERVKQRQFARLHLVCGMLSDKDSRASLQPFTDLSAKWYLAEVNSPRSASIEVLKSSLADDQAVEGYASISDAFESALENAAADDLIVVFGSFFTVSEVFVFLDQRQETKQE